MAERGAASSNCSSAIGLVPKIVIATRALRGFADGLVSIVLPAYLGTLGFSPFDIGAIATSTLIGSATLTILLTNAAHGLSTRTLLCAAAMLMAVTGVAFSWADEFWPLLLIAFVGTLNPSAGDVSVFLPLEHSELAHTAEPHRRTTLFSWYALCGTLAAAVGSLATGVFELTSTSFGVPLQKALQVAFLVYAFVGLAAFCLYLRMPRPAAEGTRPTAQRLGRSRGVVYKLAALFSMDAAAGGLTQQSLTALWLLQRFDLSIATTGFVLFWVGVLAAFANMFAPAISRRIGLIQTMAFTQVPANLCFVLLPFMPSASWALALLMLRAPFSQMDVPTRTSYLMAVVEPGERAAAASMAAVPRSLAAAASPLVAGTLLTLSPFGWQFVAAGVIKLGYNFLLVRAFRHIKPPEELKHRDNAGTDESASRHAA